MGKGISRIEKEFILNSVSDKKIEVSIHGDKVEARGGIQSVGEDFIELTGPDEMRTMFPEGSVVRVYFSYYGHVMTFQTKVRPGGDGALKCDFPGSIYKNLNRKFERVPAPAGMKISFEFKDRKVELQFPKSEEYDPVEYPQVSEVFASTNIQELMQTFREKTKYKATGSSVVMFRDREVQKYEEKLIVQTGRIFFVPNTSGRFLENDFQMGGRIVTRAMLLEYASESVEGAEDVVSTLFARKRAKGIRAEIYCPILFHEYVVGYVYVWQGRDKTGAFDHDLLDLTHQFSKILAYALKVNGYFKGAEPGANMYEGKIIDVSASGILFANNSPQLSSILLLYTDFDLQLVYGGRVLRIGVRVMRKYTGGDTTFYGIQFMEIKPEDFRLLFDLVYGRSFTSDDEDLWEGGADPPSLELV